jgi:hypothetical protein
MPEAKTVEETKNASGGRGVGVGVRGRYQKRKGAEDSKTSDRRILTEDPTLTQREFPLLVPQRAFRHHLQVQHWFGSPGPGGLPAAVQTGPDLRKQHSG